MAVKKRVNVQTLAEAVAYAKASATMAQAWKCPSAAKHYLNLANNLPHLVTTGTYAEVMGLLTADQKDIFLYELEAADNACRSAPDYRKTKPSPSSPSVPDEGEMGPPLPPGYTPPVDITLPYTEPSSGGSSWIWLLLGGGLLYLLVGKKKR